MKPQIPKGGFFASKASDLIIHQLEYKLGQSGAEVLVFPEDSIILGVWSEFPKQGLWSTEAGAVAYDIDLTNENVLRNQVGWKQNKDKDIGKLLWQLYQHNGIGFLEGLRGQFGLALWDKEKKNLVVATDPYGIRAVVFATTPRGFVGASRLHHILLHPEIPLEINPEAVYNYLFFQAICSPGSIYKGIRKLEPGKALIYEQDHIREVRYYDINLVDKTVNGTGEEHWIRAIPSRLQNAIARFVPLSDPNRTGCFLSGGTDSSSVAGYYTKLTGNSAKTFSVGFDEPGYNELDYAHIASRHFGTKQHDHYVTPDDVLSLIEELAKLYDEPFGNASVVPAYYCAKIAKDSGVEVLLAGDGGDEIFGGNERYVSNLVFERYHNIPETLRKILIEPLFHILPSVSIIHKAKRYVRRANIPNPERFFSYNLLAEIRPGQVFQKDYLAQIDTDCFLKLAQEHYDRINPAHVTNRLLYLDMKFTITDNDLRKVTQMCEAAGIRVRYPLLDQELVDFAATIPPTLKVKPGKNRYIFKKAMAGFLPPEIIQKKKHGFGLPVAPWFKKHPGLSALLNDTLFSPNARITEYVRPEFLQQMRSSFETDTTSYYGDNLWVFLMLELWLREHTR